MTMESISGLYTIFFTSFSCCRGVISVKKNSWKKNREHRKEEEGKEKRRNERVCCFPERALFVKD